MNMRENSLKLIMISILCVDKIIFVVKTLKIVVHVAFVPQRFFFSKIEVSLVLT